MEEVDNWASAGFALVIVIWAVGLMSLLAMTMIMAGHYRLKATINIVENAKAERLAEAGIALAKIALASRFSSTATGKPEGSGLPNLGPTNSGPTLCRMRTGAIAAILIEDEGGKVDLNFASLEVLVALLSGFEVSRDEAITLARSIRTFATTQPLETALELDQVPGVSPEIFSRLLPYVTVYSRHPGIDPNFASPALLAVLKNPHFAAPSRRASFLIDAEIMTPTGSYFSREAIVEWHAADGNVVTREWRRGRGRFRELLKPVMETGTETGAGLPACDGRDGLVLQ